MTTAMGRFVIELEPEVRDWLDTLTLRNYAKVEAMADILAELSCADLILAGASEAGRTTDRLSQDAAD